MDISAQLISLEPYAKTDIHYNRFFAVPSENCALKIII